MDNRQVIEQTLENYELANNALMDIWDDMEPELIDAILEKQQHRLEQIAERLYHEEKRDYDDNNLKILANTLERYDWANQYLYEHWDTLPNDERLAIMRKQWNRLESMRNRNRNIH